MNLKNWVLNEELKWKLESKTQKLKPTLNVDHVLPVPEERKKKNTFDKIILLQTDNKFNWTVNNLGVVMLRSYLLSKHHVCLFLINYFDVKINYLIYMKCSHNMLNEKKDCFKYKFSLSNLQFILLLDDIFEVAVWLPLHY